MCACFRKSTTIRLLLVCLCLQELCQAKEVCFEGFGCFSDEKPYGGTSQRPIGSLPQAPQEINTTFRLYTRNNRAGELITKTHLGSTFNPSLPTKFITHGFLSQPVEQWMLNMTDAFLDSFAMNVVYVNWVAGCGLPYQQAVSNVQIVGVEIASVIEKMVSAGAVAEGVHLIGHSLGAHASGFAGKRVKVGRISGLVS